MILRYCPGIQFFNTKLYIDKIDSVFLSKINVLGCF